MPGLGATPVGETIEQGVQKCRSALFPDARTTMRYGFEYLAAGLATFLLCSFIWSWPNFIPHVFNADVLLPTAYIWDALNHNYAWREFQLPRIPSFFPDLLFYGALHILLADYRWAIFSYSFLQCLGFVFAGGWIISAATNIRVIVASSIMLVLVSAVLISDLYLGEIYHHFSIFTLVEHFGSFLLSLSGAAIVLTTFDRWTLLRGYALVIFCFLSFLSSKLFAAVFLMPLTVALFALVRFKMFGRNLAACLVLLSVIGIGLAAIVDSFVTREPDVHLGGILLHMFRIKNMLLDIPRYFSTHFASATISIIIPCLIFLTFPLVWHEELRQNRNLVFLWIFAAMAIFDVLLICGLIYIDIGSHRYLVALLYWPIIFIGITLVLISRKVSYISTATVAIFSIFFASQLASDSFGFAHWQHPLATCLMKEQDRLGLKAGLSEYWLARPTTIGTNWIIQVDQITENGPFVWGNNPQSYLRAIGNQTRPPEYNFLVMNNLDQTALNAKFGAPDRIGSCNEYTLWIYNDTAALYKKLMAR
jgi:hypothetical protein